MKKFNLAGQRFGKWTVIEPSENRNGLTMWLCRCDCGNEKYVRSTHLLNGASKSCGCSQYDHLRNRERNYPQDIRIKRLQTIWHCMFMRCYDTSNSGYKNYGGRGIKICKEWNNYESFARWALSHGYTDELTIDRINNNGNYEPSNCRWITKQEQTKNRRNNRFETINGATKTVAEWAREYDVESSTLYRRLNRGMSIIEALAKGKRNK